MSDRSDDAVRYVKELGWSLVPIPPGTKGPNTPGWNTPGNAVSTEEGCQFWEKNPEWNMGALLSESRLAILDIDHLENTQILFDALGISYEEIVKDAPRIMGRPGRDKAIFQLPPGVTLKRHALSWPVPDDEESTDTVIEFRAGAIQDVLPPSIHPDTGMPYRWKKEPFDGIPELPPQILHIWNEWDRFKAQMEAACPWAKKASYTPPSRPRQVGKTGEGVIQKFNEAHSIEMMLEQYGYKRTRGGRYLSPFSSSGLAGVHIFREENRAYSHHASEPFDTQHGIDPFFLFAHFDHSGDVQRAVREAAKLLGLSETSVVDEEAMQHGKEVWESWKRKDDNPSEDFDLLSIPGVLQDAVDYYNTTAAKPQPRFAVQAALAVGAVVMGRRWRTDQMNYSSLYFVNVGKSASGKEHAKTVVENILEHAGIDDLIGPSGYTSGAGLLSSLMAQPSHISIMDELGRQLETSSSSVNSHKAEAQTLIMEVFGRQNGTVRPNGYSTMGLNKKQQEEAKEEDKSVRKPSLSILSMTTPETLYKSLSSKYVSDGFLGRFVIVETNIGRQVGRVVNWIDPSDRLADWCKRCATATASEGNLAGNVSHNMPPNPVIIPFDPRCHDMLVEYDAEMIGQMDKHESDGLEAMFGRTKEIAQRISLIVAVSCGSSRVMPEHLEWAIRYTRTYATQTVRRLKRSMADSPFESACKQVASFIMDGGVRGRTDREISRQCAAYRGLPPRNRQEVMDALQTDYGISLNRIEGRGAPRHAWVMPDE